MGGIGSGRVEYADTPTVSQCVPFCSDNVSEFAESPGSDGAMCWGDRGNPDMLMAIKAEGESTIVEGRADILRLIYQTEDSATGDVVEKFDYAVPLDYTECYFGGYRTWFRCPDCSERVNKLYLPPGGYRFSCRECLELGYETSRTSGDEVKQAELRYRRAFAKADKDNRRPHPNGKPMLPDRAKGQHHETFDRLMLKVRAARHRWDEKRRQKERDLLRKMRD